MDTMATSGNNTIPQIAEELGCVVRHAVRDKVRLLTPFGPLVWDRAHFQLLRGWEYRFEA